MVAVVLVSLFLGMAYLVARRPAANDRPPPLLAAPAVPASGAPSGTGASGSAPPPSPAGQGVVPLRATGPDFAVQDVCPQDGRSSQSVHSTVCAIFAIPADRASVERSFSLLPRVEGSFSWPQPVQMVFTPSRPLARATTYVARLGPGMLDASGSQRLPEFRWSFTTVGPLTFTRDIRPIIAANCVTCHQPGGAASRVPLDTYQQAMRHIVPGEAARSRFFTAPQEPMFATGMDDDAFGDEELQIVRDWINDSQAAE